MQIVSYEPAGYEVSLYKISFPAESGCPFGEQKSPILGRFFQASPVDSFWMAGGIKTSRYCMAGLKESNEKRNAFILP